MLRQLARGQRRVPCRRGAARRWITSNSCSGAGRSAHRRCSRLSASPPGCLDHLQRKRASLSVIAIGAASMMRCLRPAPPRYARLRHSGAARCRAARRLSWRPVGRGWSPPRLPTTQNSRPSRALTHSKGSRLALGQLLQDNWVRRNRVRSSGDGPRSRSAAAGNRPGRRRTMPPRRAVFIPRCRWRPPVTMPTSTGRGWRAMRSACSATASSRDGARRR